MAYVTTVKPNGVYRRIEGTSYWKSIERLWDGNDETAPTSQSGNVWLKLDMSWLPVNMKITQITVRYVFNRKDSGMPPCHIGYANTASYGTSSPETVQSVTLGTGTYNVRETHAGTVYLTEEESEAFARAVCPLILVGRGALSTAYELTLDVYFEEKGRNVYAGGKVASAVYVGGTKATAVYIGDTKVL